jgi:hypothetical protein
VVFFFLFLFVCSIILGFLFLFLFPIFSFLYYQLHHHYLLIPTLTLFTLPPSAVVQSIALIPNYSFCPFSSTLSPCLCLPSHPPQPVTKLHLPLTQLPLLTNPLYQLYTPQHPAIPFFSFIIHMCIQSLGHFSPLPPPPPLPPTPHPPSPPTPQYPAETILPLFLILL